MADAAALRRRIADLYDRLAELPSDDFASRFELQAERDRLVDELRQLEGTRTLVDDRPDEEIEREIEALRATAAGLRRQRIDLVKQAGGGRTNEFGNQGGFQLNQQIDEATGLNRIEQRIGQLEGTLAVRRADAAD